MFVFISTTSSPIFFLFHRYYHTNIDIDFFFYECVNEKQNLAPSDAQMGHTTQRFKIISLKSQFGIQFLLVLNRSNYNLVQGKIIMFEQFWKKETKIILDFYEL